MRTGISKKIARFILMVVGIAAICLLALGFAVVSKMRFETIGEKQKQDAQIFSAFAARFIDNQVNEIKSYAASPWWKDAAQEANRRYQDLGPQAIRDHMTRMDEAWRAMADSKLQEWLGSNMGRRLRVVAETNDVIAEIFLTDQYGGLVAASGKTSDFYQADEAWWQHAYNDGHGHDYFGEIELDESTGKMSSAIAVPMRDERGRIIGIVKAIIDTDVFFSEMSRYKFGKTGHSALLDGQGKVIYHTGLTAMSQSPLTGMMLGKLLDGRHDFMFMDLGAAEGLSLVSAARVYSRSLTTNGIHWVSVVTQGVQEILFSLYVIFGAGSIMMLFFSFWLIRVIRDRITAILIFPIQKIRDGMRRFSRGEQDYKMELKTGDEIEDLANAFNEMTGQLEKTTVSKDYLDNIMGSIADSLVVIDPGAKITIVNKAICALLGYAEEDLLGKDVSLLFSEEEIPFKGAKLEKLLKEGALRNYEMNFRAKDARSIPIVLSAAVLKNREHPQGTPIDVKVKGAPREKVLGVVCIAKDITERKQLEKEARKHLKELEVFYKASVGREERILELKNKVTELEQKLKGQGT